MKKAFTLIELISVIVILSIIALISVPITTNIINSSRNKAYEETINNIIEISKNYSVYNNLGYNTLYKELTFDELSNKGYIESSDIINPKTNQKLAGCVIYRWVIGSNQYEFKYDETCNGKASYPEIVINVTPDSESWITEKPTFDIEGEYDSFKYCIEESECNPNIDYNNRVTVEKESKNLIICATGYNNKEVGKTTCTKGYKVDRTNPTLTYNITTSTNKIIVNASCTDDISGISKKEYSINDKEYQDNNTFSNLSKGTYKISIKCTDNAGLTTVKSSNVALENIKNPVIAQLSQIPANTSYAQQRIIKINYSSEGIENPEYYFKSSVAASVSSGVVVQSCGTGNTPSTCTTSSVTSLVANTWYRTNNSSINVTYTSNGTLYAVTKDNTNISGTSTYSIANIDTTKPSITMKVSTKTDRATLTLTCNDSDSGITKYEYSKDNGSTWVTGTTNSYTYTGLTQGTSYKYVGRCTNGSGLTNTSSSTNTTNTITNPVIVQASQNPSSGTWAQSRVIKITYSNANMNNAYYYFKSSVAASVASGTVVESCGTGNTPSTCTTSNVTSISANTWYRTNNSSINVTYTSNGTLYAVTKDNTNISGTSTYSIANIDTTKPSITTSSLSTSTDNIVILAKCSDSESGITKYEFSNDNGTTWVTGGTTYNSNSKYYKFTDLTQGTKYTFAVRCTNGSGLTNISVQKITTLTISKPTIVQASQTPSSGTYATSRTIKITYDRSTISTTPKYYFKSSVAASVASGVVVQSCGTGNTPSTCTTSSVTSLVANTWYRTNNSSINVTYTSNGTLYAVTKDNTNISGTSTYSIANIDTTKPSITMKVSTKTDRATLTLTCNDSDSGITKYEYSKDNGSTWVTGTTNSYTYTGLTQGTSYKYVGRCTNGSGLSNTSSSTNSTNTITNPTIVQVSQSPSGTWAVSRTIRITYYNTNIVGARYYYSYNGSDWIEVSGTTDLTFTSNSLLYAKTTDASGNYKTASTYTVTNIESSDPSIPSITYNGGSNTCSWKNNYNLTLSSSASSGIAYYEIDVDNNGTSDGTTGSNFIPSNGWSTCSARFRAVTNAGRRSGWTDIQHIHMDTTGPSTPSITYNGGSNTCSWKNNYDLTLSSSDNIGVSYYQIDVDGNGTADRNINSNWIPENGFHSHNVKFRAVDYAGNVSGWTSGQHIHMDTTTPTITLADLPTIINYKDNYKLPSSYSFGAGGGSVSCTINGTSVTNTSVLRPAAYPVYCTATSSSGLSTTIRKDIQVKPVIDLSGIPDDFYSGASYSIPTAVNYGDHGGSTVCKINGTVVTNTNILTGGTTYWIECTATTAQGVVNSTKRIITVRPSIDLSGIPASFKAGSSYSIPSQPVNYGVQGGSTVCKINGTVVTNTNILTGGSNYVINCTAVSNYKNITGTASKTIYVYN